MPSLASPLACSPPHLQPSPCASCHCPLGLQSYALHLRGSPESFSLAASLDLQGKAPKAIVKALEAASARHSAPGTPGSADAAASPGGALGTGASQVPKSSKGSLLASLALLQASALLQPHVASLGAPLAVPASGRLSAGGARVVHEEVSAGGGAAAAAFVFGAQALAPAKEAQETFLQDLASGDTPAVPLLTAISWLLAPPSPTGRARKCLVHRGCGSLSFPFCSCLEAPAP